MGQATIHERWWHDFQRDSDVAPSNYGWGSGLVLSATDHHFHYWVVLNGVAIELVSTTPVQVGQWYHVVGQYSGTQTQIWVNNKLENSSSQSGSLRVGSNPSYIAAQGSTSSPGIFPATDVTIDEVAVYGQVLSPNRVQVHYELGKATLGFDQNDPNATTDPGGDLKGIQIVETPDPVSTLNGDYQYKHTDVAIPGRGPSPTFTRIHNSNDPRTGPMGPGWRHAYVVHLDSSGDPSGDVYLVGAEGRSDRYQNAGNNSFTPPNGVTTQLVINTERSVRIYGDAGRSDEMEFRQSGADGEHRRSLRQPDLAERVDPYLQQQRQTSHHQ